MIRCINIEIALQNAARSIDNTNGSQPADNVTAHALVSIANSLAAIAQTYYESSVKYTVGDQHLESSGTYIG